MKNLLILILLLIILVGGFIFFSKSSDSVMLDRPDIKNPSVPTIPADLGTLPINKSNSADKNVPKTVYSFEECAKYNPVAESFPRQCWHNGTHFIEDVSVGIPDFKGTLCEDPRPEACTLEYAPVCATVNVQCVTEPCYPVLETFGNGCSACGNQLVSSYIEGECPSGE